MRTYETIYIIQPEAAEDQVETVIQEVESLVAEDGGTVVRKDLWGKRRLAYHVKGFQEGIYVLMRFECGPAFPRKLEDFFKLNESVIRYLVVLFDVKTLRLEEEQARRNQAALESRNAAAGDGPRRADVPPARRESKDAVEAVEA